MVGGRAGRSQPMNLSAAKSRNLWAAVLILGATLLAYLPAVSGGLLWDDDGHVTRAELQSFEGLRRIWFEVGATQQYYPLLHTAFWVEHQLWGDAVVGYHLTNIFLHAAAALLVVAIVRRLFQQRTGPAASLRAPGTGGTAGGPGREGYPGVEWLAGFIFALHPVCVESVAWISEQKNTLSAVFYLGAALAYLGFDRDRRPSRYWVALGLFGLALLSKTVTATLPAALLVVIWWTRGRLSWARDVRPLLPWLALGGTAGLFSAWVERALIGARGADFALTALERCLLAGRVIWFYLGKLVWPADLAFIYPRWVVDATVWWQYLFPVGVLAALVGLGLVARRPRGPRARAAAAGLAGFLVFAGTLFPVLGFVNVYPFVFSYVADHFQYLASVGVIVPVAAALTHAARRIVPGARQLAPVAGAVLLAALGVLTWRQAGVYRNAQTLYRETLVLNPACPMAHNNLGLVLSQIPGRLPEAISHYEAALRSDPRNLEAHLNLGYALARMPGRLADAVKVDEAAVRLGPGRADAHDNLALALSQVPGRMADAVAEFEAAVRLQPDSAEIRDHLGTALVSMPARWPEAIDHLERAVQLDPGSATIHDHLGVALAKAPGRTLEAVGQFEEALRIGLDSAEVHCHLGAALAKVAGRMPDAVAQFEAAVRIDPASVDAHDSLGKILMGIPGRLPEAIAHLEAAVRLDSASADRHGALGSALLKDPARLPEAIAQFEAVVRINPGLAEGHFVLGVLLSGEPARQQEALAQFEAALKIRPDFAAAREWVERLRAVPVH